MDRNPLGSISRGHRSISRSTSTSRSGSPAQGTMALSHRPTWRSRCPSSSQTASNHPAPFPVPWPSVPTGSVQTPVASDPGRHGARRKPAGAASAIGAGAGQHIAGAGAGIRRRLTTAQRSIRSLFQLTPDQGRGDTTHATAGSPPVAVVSAAQIAALAPPAPAVAAGRRAKAQERQGDRRTRARSWRRAPASTRSATPASARSARVGRTARCG